MAPYDPRTGLVRGRTRPHSVLRAGFRSPVMEDRRGSRYAEREPLTLWVTMEPEAP